MIEVHWNITLNNLYRVTIEVTGTDHRIDHGRNDGSFESKIKISSLNARVGKENMAAITLTLDITNLNQLEHIMIKLRRIKNVYNVHRATPALGGT